MLKNIIRSDYFTFLIFTIILLVGNNVIPLWNQDEAAYAGFSYTMNHTGNWLIPEFMWAEVHRKTPFAFWCMALLNKLFGFSQFVLRLTPVLSMLGVFLLIKREGRKFWSPETISMALMIFSTNVLISVYGKIAFVDGTLLFFETLAAFGILNLFRQYSLKWFLLFWIAITGGLLTKGPPVIIFCTVFAGLMIIRQRSLKGILHFRPWFGIFIGILPLLAWGYMAWQQDNGQYIKWMIDWYTVSRVTGAVFDQTGPPGYYLATYLGAILPWIWLLIPLFSYIFKSKNKQCPEACWLLAGWIIYEFMASKLPAYGIASHPALAIFLANAYIQVKDRWKGPVVLKSASVFNLLLTLALIPVSIYVTRQYQVLKEPVAIAFIAFTLVLLIKSAVDYLKDRPDSGIRYQFYFNSAIILFAWNFVITSWTTNTDKTGEIAKYVHSIASPSDSIYIQNTIHHPPSLPFYIVRNGNPLIKQISSDSTELLFSSSKNVVWILDRKIYEVIKDQVPPYKSIISGYTDRTSTHEYIIVKK